MTPFTTLSHRRLPGPGEAPKEAELSSGGSDKTIDTQLPDAIFVQVLQFSGHKAEIQANFDASAFSGTSKLIRGTKDGWADEKGLIVTGVGAASGFYREITDKKDYFGKYANGDGYTIQSHGSYRVTWVLTDKDGNTLYSHSNGG